MTGAVELEQQIRELVDECLEHGSLFGRGRGKTLTLGGRRRWLVRVQVDIIDSSLGSQMGWRYYPDLQGLIDQAVAEWRAAR